MCGRFTLTATEDELLDLLAELETSQLSDPRYNIAPSQPIAAVLNDGKRRITAIRWGLIPSWAKDSAIGNRMINARAETIAEKPSFQKSFQTRRCLIPANGFYEWKRDSSGKSKVPFYIRMKSARPFFLAGLWDVWNDPDGQPITSGTIITTAPNELVSPIHDRMPVILAPESYELWLAEGGQRPEELAACLKPYPAGQMEIFAVSTWVNNPRNDDSRCISEEPSLLSD